MAILGESFKPYVRNQINVRQDKLSLDQNRDDNTLKYITSKTSFLRLTSGVDISGEVAQNLGVPNYNGSGLASQYVLFSSRFNKPPFNKSPLDGDFTSGVGYSSGFNTSYGFNSDINFGLVPPPGLTTAEVKTLNRGTIREATINLICHNLYQFKIINALFLKLKYSLLLEWGHTLYFNNGSKTDSTPSLITPVEADSLNLSSDFLAGMSSDEILSRIEENRERSCGNYDAFFGVVKNFNWELQENGSYNVMVNAISQGDVIDSLKLNTNFSPDKTIAPIQGVDENMYKKSTLHYILGVIINMLNNSNTLDGFGTNALNTVALAQKSQLKYGYKESDDTVEANKVSNSLTYKEGVKITFSELGTTTNESGAKVVTPQYYIKLGTLLRIIESFLLYYDTSKNNNSKTSPSIFYINHSFATGSNECITTPRHISTDPLTCLIPFDFGNASEASTGVKVVYKDIFTKNTYTLPINPDGKATGNNLTSTSTESLTNPPNDPPYAPGKEIVISAQANVTGQLTAIKSGETTLTEALSIIDDPSSAAALVSSNGQTITLETKTYTSTAQAAITNASQAGTLSDIDTSFRSNDKNIGNTMHIYVNVNKIIETLNDNTDNNGNVSMQNFLSQLLSAIGQAMGCINKFDLDYDETTNRFSVIDTAVFPLKYRKVNNTAKFNINLLKDSNNGGGSFVTNFGLKSDVFGQISNAIAIGSQANGNTLGSNSTPISNFNVGLTDRTMTVKQNPNDDTSDPNQSWIDKNPETFQRYETFKRRIADGDVTTNDIDLYKSFLVDLFNYDLGYYTENAQIPGTGFIPLNLSLTMDGLSGIRQYQTFDIDETLLPNEYTNRLKFITTTVTHKIDTKGWETSVNSLGVPKTNKDPKPVDQNIPKVVDKPKPSSGAKKTKTKTTVTDLGNFSGSTREPRSIILHYTDYPDDGPGVAKAVRSHGTGFGIHHVVQKDGVVFSDIPEDKKSYHGDYWNPFGIGIEIVNEGSVIPISEQAKRGYKGPKPKIANAAFYENVYNPAPGEFKGERYFTADEVATLDFKYGGKQYFVEYTDLQINALEKLIREIFGRWPGINQNISGKNLWEWVFGFHGSTLEKGRPVAGKNYTSLTAGTSEKYRKGKLQDTEYDYTFKMLGGEGGYLGPKGYDMDGFNVKGGIYSHATGGGSHFDVVPTPKIVAMLVRLGYINGY